jgi:hypothetical protein
VNFKFVAPPPRFAFLVISVVGRRAVRLRRILVVNSYGGKRRTTTMEDSLGKFRFISFLLQRIFSSLLFTFGQTSEHHRHGWSPCTRENVHFEEAVPLFELDWDTNSR